MLPTYDRCRPNACVERRRKEQGARGEGREAASNIKWQVVDKFFGLAIWPAALLAAYK